MKLSNGRTKPDFAMDGDPIYKACLECKCSLKRQVQERQIHCDGNGNKLELFPANYWDTSQAEIEAIIAQARQAAEARKRELRSHYQGEARGLVTD